MRNTRKQELIWLYDLGERNFQQQNLRGESFRGANLSDADFSGCDIRGADFTKAILVNANFSHATAGLYGKQATVLLAALVAGAALLGLVAGLIGTIGNVSFVPAQATDPVDFSWVTPIVIVGFAVVSLTHNMSVGFGVFAAAFMLALVGALVTPLAVPVAGSLAADIAVNSLVAGATAAVSALFVAAVLAFRTWYAIVVGAAFIIAFAAAILLIQTTSPASSADSVVMVASIVLPMAGYVGWRTLRGDRKHTITWRVANFLATRWGTSFRGADLTNADFSQAILKSTDFSKAVLTHTRWDHRTRSRSSAK